MQQALPNEQPALGFALSPEHTHVYVTFNDVRLPGEIDPDQLDALIAQLKDRVYTLQWAYGRTHWQVIRRKSQSKRGNKWYFLQNRQNTMHCSQGPSVGYGELEIAESPRDLWDGAVRKQCVFAWTQLIQQNVVRYHLQESEVFHVSSLTEVS